jgi:hypothetical protein
VMALHSRVGFADVFAMTPLDAAALAGPVAAVASLALHRVRRRAASRRRAAEAAHAEYLGWMRELVAFMDAPKGYAGGLANVVINAADADGCETAADAPVPAAPALAMLRDSLTA